MAFKAVNDSAGPNGLIPTLLVYGAYPRMTINDTTPTVSRRAAAIKKAMTELRKIQAKRQVTDVLTIRNRPIITLIYTLALNSSVLV